MSVETVKQIIGRAIKEPEYRELLFNNPDEALEGLDLTMQEATALKAVKGEDFDALAGELAERISRAGLDLGLLGNADSEVGVRVHSPIRVVKTND